MVLTLTRILEERSFSKLAEELGISYKATTHSYYRFIERIRKMMGGGGKMNFKELMLRAKDNEKTAVDEILAM